MLKSEYQSGNLYRIRLLGKLKTGFFYIGGLLLLEIILIATIYFFSTSGRYNNYQLSPCIFMVLIPCAALPVFMASNPELRHNKTLCLSEKTVLEVDYTIIGLFVFFAALIGAVLPLMFRMFVNAASLPTDIVLRPYNVTLSGFFIEFAFGVMLGLMSSGTIYAIMRARVASLSSAAIILLFSIAFVIAMTFAMIPIYERLKNSAASFAIVYSVLVVVTILANVGSYFAVKKGDAFR